MAPHASLEDGKLDVVLVGHAPRARFLRLLPTVFKGEHVEQPNVQVLRASQVDGHRGPAVHDVRRRRPDRGAAGHGPCASGGREGDRAAMTALGPKIAAARAVGSIARRAGRGGGTSLPGKLLMRLEPHAIGELAARLPRGTVMVSATNGKTTTAAMIASILERAGISLVHNRAGANMAGGVASTLLRAARAGGRIDGELGLFEVDEFWLDRLTSELEPRALLLCNLFRDQLDRYGELESIADRWAQVVSGSSARARPQRGRPTDR